MASQNNSDKDIIPMGKAIAIIVSVVVGVVGIIGGLMFFMLNMNNFSTSSGVISSKNDTEKIIGEWKKLNDEGAYATVSGTDSKWAESYEYGVNALLAGIESVERYSDTITFKRDGSYIRIVPQLNSKGFMTPDYVFDEGTYELKGTNLTLYPDTSKEKTYKINFDGDRLIFDGYTYKGGGLATYSQSNQNASNKENVASSSLPSEYEKTLATDWNTILGEWKFTAYDYTGYQSSATEGTINIKEITERTIVVDINSDISTALNKSLRYELDEKKQNLTFKHEWTMAERGLILDKNYNSVEGTVKYSYTFNFTENSGSVNEYAILYNGKTNTVYTSLDKDVFLNRLTDNATNEQVEDIIPLEKESTNDNDSESQVNRIREQANYAEEEAERLRQEAERIRQGTSEYGNIAFDDLLNNKNSNDSVVDSHNYVLYSPESYGVIDFGELVGVNEVSSFNEYLDEVNATVYAYRYNSSDIDTSYIDKYSIFLEENGFSFDWDLGGFDSDLNILTNVYKKNRINVMFDVYLNDDDWYNSEYFYIVFWEESY